MRHRARQPEQRADQARTERARPDIVMASRAAVEAMPSRPGWQTLSALRGRSCGFDTEHYELLIRPGPRMGEAALVMAECLAGLEGAR
ncbi:MAG TPA: hypothetical protein VKI18_13165 [Albitalea sp.]|nr:hypothetical protein [Albitalea sp.]